MYSHDELYKLIASHDQFFGKIIDIIPKDLYKAKEESEESLANAKYYKVGWFSSILLLQYFTYIRSSLL